MLNLGILMLSVFGLTAILVNLVRRYALKHLLDCPNQRSSHITPTPRGGGVACVLIFALAVGFLFWIQRASWSVLLTSILGLIIAGVGFWDDHRSISAYWRFLIHGICGFIVVLCLRNVFDYFPENENFILESLAILGGVFFLTWILNLFNFMDGIDGLAASEASFVAFSLAAFSWIFDVDLALLDLLLGMVSLGFLVWNFPPAKIFMGDVGSGFFGFMLGSLILMSGQKDPILIVIGLILFAVFVADATYTLIYRIFTGQKWYQAHCTHAYQKAAKQYGHLHVLKVSMAINLLYLLPLSFASFSYPEMALVWLLLAYCPLIWLVNSMSAGVVEEVAG
jgi:Fuc2NAc and GlcNAc transferase